VSGRSQIMTLTARHKTAQSNEISHVL